MEEASALATKVGIMAKQVLGQSYSVLLSLFLAVKHGFAAVGTTKDLEDRYATYQVHFSARTRALIGYTRRFFCHSQTKCPL